MHLPQRVNQSLSRIASVAGGARTDGWVKNLPLAVSALLVVLLAWQLVQLGWAALGARNAQPLAVGDAVVGGAASAASGRRVDLNAIINAHLFGEAAAPGAGDTDPNAVAATQMPLVLVGTIAHSNPELGYAIIGESPTTAKVYAVGKTITGGTKLHSVYPDRAILDRGGKLEALLLPKRFQGGGMATAAPLPGAPRTARWARSCDRSPRTTRRRSPTSCDRSRSSRAARSGATGSIPVATAPSSTSSGSCPATSSRRSTARRSTIPRAAWRSCRR